VTTNLADLRRIAELATPGPWYCCFDVKENEHRYTVQTALKEKNMYIGSDEQALIGSTFIACANPKIVLELIDRLEAAGDEMKRMSEIIYKEKKEI
jgi:hypothetical protein